VVLLQSLVAVPYLKMIIPGRWFVILSIIEFEIVFPRKFVITDKQVFMYTIFNVKM